MRFLASFYYISKKFQTCIEALYQDFPLMLDSGAFSAMMMKKEIDLPDFMRYCHANRKFFEQYVMLDVIGNKERTRENLMTMLRDGLMPMPVLTTDMDESEFKDLHALNPNVCISGGRGQEPVSYSARIEKCWRLVDGKTTIHGLGYTKTMEPIKTKCSSVDSASWSFAQRAGMLYTFTLNKGMMQTMMRDLQQKAPVLWPPEIRDQLMRSGVTPQELFSKEGRTGQDSVVALISLASWIAYSKHCLNKGLRVYFAVSTPGALWPFMVAAYNRKGNGLDWAEAKKQMPMVQQNYKKDFDRFVDYARAAGARESARTQ